MPASNTNIVDLYKYQIGKETTWGTAVTPTAQLGLVEKLDIMPEVEAENIKDSRGTLAPAYQAALYGSNATAKASGIMPYEDLPYFLDNMCGEATPSGANPYVYAYSAPLGTLPTRRIWTIVKGMSAPTSNIYGLAGGVLTELTLKTESKKPLTYDATFAGKSMASVSLAALSDRSLTPIMAHQASIYIDAVGGTIGSTAVTTLWFSWELNIKTNAAVNFGIGSQNAVGFREAKWEVKEKFKMEIDATTKAMLDSIIGTSLLQKQIRTKFTTGASAIAQFDTGVSFLKSPEFTTDTDGVSTLEFEATSIYNTALANHFKASVTNTVSTLP